MVLDDGGHAEIVYDNVRVPQENLLGELHDSFAMAQARLGPVRFPRDAAHRHGCARLRSHV